MLAGLAFQVFSLILFAIAAGWFAYSVWANKESWDSQFLALSHSRLFKIFLVGLTIATVTIFIRSVYRCVELSGGFDGKLFTSDEALFMVLEGVMIIFAGICLTFLHPGISFQGSWREINYSFHHKGEAAPEKMATGSPSDGSIAEHGAVRPARNNGQYNIQHNVPQPTHNNARI